MTFRQNTDDNKEILQPASQGFSFAVKWKDISFNPIKDNPYANLYFEQVQRVNGTKQYTKIPSKKCTETNFPYK
jgi:ethanolamine ammonia-lyase large subunit